MTAQLLPNFVQTFFDSNGVALAGGKLYTYAAGTTTPLATYTDEGAGTPNTNPIVLDASGSAAVWLGSSAYKFVLQDSLGNTIRTVDNVSIINPASIDKTKIFSDIAGVALAQNGSGALDVQVDNVTIDVNGSNELEVKDASITAAKIAAATIDTTKINNLVEVVFKGKFDATGEGIKAMPIMDWSSPSLITMPSITGLSGSYCSWSENCEFLALGTIFSTGIFIFHRIGSTFTDITTAFFGSALSLTSCTASFSPASKYFALTLSASPYFALYSINQTNATGLTLTAPASGATRPKFAPNGNLVIVPNSSSSVSDVYTINGSTITKSVSPPTGTLTTGSCAAWSPDNKFLALGSSATPYFNIFTHDLAAFTKITNPVDMPASGVSELEFSPDGKFLAVSMASSPYIMIYSISGTTFTKLADPAKIPSTASPSISWFPNGKYLAVADGSGASPYHIIYSVSGSTFTSGTNTAPITNSSIKYIKFSPDGQFMAVTNTANQNIDVYQTSYTFPSTAILWTRGVNNV